MVKRDLSGPRRLVVAAFAARSFLTFVSVVFAVARNASALNFGSDSSGSVTTLAAGAGMGTAQRKMRVAVVVEAGLFPARGVVAALAFGAVAAFVRVVFLMAAYASHRQLAGRPAACVAGIACKRGMPPGQREACLAAVIEGDGRPAGDCVAAFAFGAVATLMLVVELMAGEAGARRALVLAGCVTTGAGGCGVFALQGEPGGGVVELCLLPTRLAVAAGARCAKAPLVAVIFAMAVDASGRRVSKFGARLVAGYAGDAGVSAVERIVGEAVVECFAVERRQIGFAALVLGMTLAALGGACARGTAVEAELCLNVVRDLLVTGQTELRLALLVELLVAIGTVYLELFVGATELAGRHQLVEHAGCGRGLCAANHEEKHERQT